MKNIKTLLCQEKSVNAWQWTHKIIQRNELYLVRNDVESRRFVQLEEDDLLIHCLHNDGKLGEGSLSVQGEIENWQGLIAQSVERSKYIHNPYYEFSKPWTNDINNYSVFDPKIEEKLRDSLEDVKLDIMRWQKKNSGVKISYIELFYQKSTEFYENSFSHTSTIDRSEFTIDYSLLNEDESVENCGLFRRNFLLDLNFEETLTKEAGYLLDINNATTIATGNYSVIMADEALDSIFDFFLEHLSGRSLYNNYSIFQNEKKIFSDIEPYEKISIKTNPFLVGGSRGGVQDSFGFPLQKLVLIENNQIGNFSIDGKHSFLLNTPITTATSNIEVAPGNTSYDEFINNGVVELLRFSTFNPDPISGSFAGEIRLGYLYKNGKKIPLKGGSVSGLSLRDFAKAKFSLELEKRGFSSVPKGIWFESLSIAGD